MLDSGKLEKLSSERVDSETDAKLATLLGNWCQLVGALSRWEGVVISR